MAKYRGRSAGYAFLVNGLGALNQADMRAAANAARPYATIAEMVQQGLLPDSALDEARQAVRDAVLRERRIAEAAKK